MVKVSLLELSVMRFSRYALSLLLVLACACGGGPTPRAPQAAATATPFQEGQIIDVATGLTLPRDLLFAKLLQQHVIYLGEEHHNRHHVESAVLLLQQLTADGRRPVVAMEMFGWDGQPVIDRFLSTADDGGQNFPEQVRWQQSWGGPFEDYEPLVRFAKDHQLRLVALNPPKSLIRTVAKSGLEQGRRSPEMIQWHMQDETISDDPAYRDRILQQLRACHDGGSETMYQTMYEASMVRDEGMAKTIVSEVNRLRAEDPPSAGPVISYTGGGHIQYNLPVPQRVARRLQGDVRQVSLYMTSFEKERLDDLRNMISEKIADYIWLTPVSAHGPPRRCR